MGLSCTVTMKSTHLVSSRLDLQTFVFIIVKQKLKVIQRKRKQIWVNDKAIREQIIAAVLDDCTQVIIRRCRVVEKKVDWDYLLMGWMLEGWKQVSWSCMLLLNLFSSSSSNLETKTDTKCVKSVCKLLRIYRNSVWIELTSYQPRCATEGASPTPAWSWRWKKTTHFIKKS